MSSDSVLLNVINLKKYYSVSSGLIRNKRKFFLKAVDGVSFEVYEGETFGLVGESGCGKTTIAKSIVKLEVPTDGEIRYKGKDIYQIRGQDEKEYKREVQIVFQDPNSSLDPRMTVGDSVEEAFIANKIYEESKRERKEKVKELFELVGLKSDYLKRYPHELSGGEKQRVGIARALAVNPKLIIADEPVSALDISVRAQILNLFLRLKKEHGLSYLFIAHDLSVIRNISDRVGIMFRGQIVEMADTKDVFEEPLHPYTKVLLGAIPVLGRKERLKLDGGFYVNGKVNERGRYNTGCVFSHFCKDAGDCRVEKGLHEIEMKEARKGHFVACRNY